MSEIKGTNLQLYRYYRVVETDNCRPVVNGVEYYISRVEIIGDGITQAFGRTNDTAVEIPAHRNAKYVEITGFGGIPRETAEQFGGTLPEPSQDYLDDEMAARVIAEAQGETADIGMTRGEILDTAKDAVTRDRAAVHGGAEHSFTSIAAIWSSRLGVDVTPEQVCIMMIDLKTVRAWGNPGHKDNWIDMAGYAACGGELSNERQ